MPKYYVQTGKIIEKILDSPNAQAAAIKAFKLVMKDCRIKDRLDRLTLVGEAGFATQEDGTIRRTEHGRAATDIVAYRTQDILRVSGLIRRSEG